MRVSIRFFLTIVGLGVTIPCLFLVTGSWSGKNWSHSASSPPAGHPSQTWSDKMATGQPSTAGQRSTRVSNPLWWRNHIQKSCKKLGLSNAYNYLDPDLLKHTKIIVDDNNKLLYCQIPKVASTTWRRILIFLSGKVDISDPMSIASNDAHHKYDQHLTYLSDLPYEAIVHRLKNYFKFVFVREPFERLLSAFRNKFVANTNSSMYFKRVFGRKLIDKYRLKPLTNNNGSGLTFPEFVDYLIDPDKKVAINEHWERFHKLCHPCLITYDFIGKLQTIDEDSRYIMDRTDLTGKVKVPSRSDSKYAHQKTNVYMGDYYSQISRSSLVKLYNMYYADFLIFNFTVPETIQKMLHMS